MRHFEQVITSLDSPFTAGNSDHILADTDGGAITINLKYSQDTRQAICYVWNIGSSSNNVTVGLERTGDTINGGSTVTISDGEEWIFYAGPDEWIAKQLYPGQDLAPDDSVEFDSIQFDLTPSATPEEGLLIWNSDDGTLNLGMPGGNVTLQIGQETIVKCKNATAGDFTNGQAVYISGASGSNPEIELADNDDPVKSDCILGILTEDIDAGQHGYVTVSGLVRDVDTSSFGVGDKLYVDSTPGALTNVAPVTPKHLTIVGMCIVSHATEGVIYVRIKTGFHLEHLHDVYGSTSQDGTFLVWDQTNGYWTPTTTLVWTGSLLGVGTISPEGKLHVKHLVDEITVLEHVTTNTTNVPSALKLRTTSTGDMTDNFGTSVIFQIEDDAGVVNPIGVIQARRNGADNTGKMRLGITSAGSFVYPIEMFADGTIRAGGSSNYTEIEADGTIELVGDATVYNDLQFQISGAKVPAANYPDWETFTTNTMEYGFGVDEYVDLDSNELPHGWKLGGVVDVHLHVTTKAANSSGADRFAKFTVYIAYGDPSNAWTETSLTAELTIPDGTPALMPFYLDMGNLDLTGYGLSTHLKPRIKRITATGGTEYSGNIFINQLGVHNQQDTIGSRQETTK